MLQKWLQNNLARQQTGQIADAGHSLKNPDQGDCVRTSVGNGAR